ncbi:MAG: pectate lyase [Bacteroidales bacterium]|nr:pectate lyase [Bacteroidales bacterium]
MKRNLIYFLILLFSTQIIASNQTKSPIEFKNGEIIYNETPQGDRIPDFSYAGYMGREKEIPNPSPTIILSPIQEDATDYIQEAINHISTFHKNEEGIRGVILLRPGIYKINGQLHIKKSGIILRGSGVLDEETQIIATGKDRRTLIEINGLSNKIVKDTFTITNSYVPVNALSLKVKNISSNSIQIGDKIAIVRPATQKWIEALGTWHFGGGITTLGWKPENHNITWDRTVVNIKENEVFLDAPITTAIDSNYGGGYVVTYAWDGRIDNVGIENLILTSAYDVNNSKDEDHSWTAITLNNTIDSWVRNIFFKHFAGSAVLIEQTSQRITVENCKSLAPISEIGGYRRNTFITYGQQTLFQNIYSEYGYHDFALGLGSAGPNAFVQCYAYKPYSFSGPIDSWSSGVLFDIATIDGNALSYKNRYQNGQGAGWNAANSVFWQCSASLIECFSPPTAENWAFGSWADFSGNGYWENSNNHVKPRSLYYAQLQDRLKENNISASILLDMGDEASSSPTVEVAIQLTKLAEQAAPNLYRWIDQLIKNTEIEANELSAKPFIYERDRLKNNKKAHKDNHVSIINGRLVKNDQLISGNKHSVQWWNGNLKPRFIENSAKPHITRFVPGRYGRGYTDYIPEVIKWMKDNNLQVLDHNYGLWYDRRRDDHERIRRINGDVWAPFYEQPFARSGEGIAYDGLSKYDLTKYNTWYWDRLKQFADLADEKNILLFHQNYFQHNIIEAGAHWTDSPWRPENNINETGFPEPAPYAGDKRIFLAEQFYDIHHPIRRPIHKAYIRKCLDNFYDNSNVIHLISEEYTGPLHFVQFWLDVIAEWEKENNKELLIALSTTKDVQDAILSDPKRAKTVDIIDIKYWFYREDGTTYEPQGGVNLAPRQHARKIKPGKTSFKSVYRAVKEYRIKHPEKAVCYYSNSYPEYAWASFMATGSLPCLPTIENKKLLEDVTRMNILEEMCNENQVAIGNPKVGFVIYSEEENLSIDLPLNNAKYNLYKIDKNSGKITKEKTQINRKQNVLNVSKKNKELIWIERI